MHTKLLACLPIVLLGCTSTPEPTHKTIGNTPPLPSMYTGRLPEPNSALDVDPHVRPMSRNEVLTAIQECEGNGARAVIVYGKRRINNYTTDIVIDVTCAPKYKLLF
jgi:hypothetical protein